MNTAKDAKARKEVQRKRQALLGVKRVEVALSACEREQLETLRRARAGSGEPYSSGEPCCAATENAGSNNKRSWPRKPANTAATSSRVAAPAHSRARRHAGTPSEIKAWHCDRSENGYQEGWGNLSRNATNCCSILSKRYTHCESMNPRHD